MMRIYVYVNKDAEISQKNKSLFTALITNVTKTKYSNWKYNNNELYRNSGECYIHLTFQYVYIK